MDEPGVFYVVERRAVVTGEQLVDSQPSFDQNGRPAVTFRFNPSGGAAFGAYTAENIGKPFAIVLDNQVISAPVIQAHIAGGSGIITGNFTPEESSRLVDPAARRRAAGGDHRARAAHRRAGARRRTRSARAPSRRSWPSPASSASWCCVYGFFGMIASVALVMNMVLTIALLSMLGATLTMPGIAGLVLGLGMAVDANVLIYERIREELRTARGPARAIELGFDKAFSPILDGNVTTLIVAIILYLMGAGPVRGFGITLALGLICSMFTAISLSRLLIAMWFDRRRPKTLAI